MADEDSEDDYLTMTFEEPTRTETSLQRAARLKREAAQRSHQPSKAEREAAQQEATRTALATQLDESNKGAQMLKRMGFKGGALGKSDSARTEPIALEVKSDRAGIGIEDEKKRKLREAVDQLEDGRKRQKANEDDYRKRLQTETEERRAEGQIMKAMRALEDLHEREMAGRIADGESSTDADNVPIEKRPLHRVPLLYRPLIRKHREDEAERRRRPLLMVGRQSSSLPQTTLENSEDADHGGELAEVEDVDDEDEDVELDEFLALSAVERLERTVKELRQKYHYCFWCMHRYKDDAELEAECPGLTEDEHDA